MDSLEGSLMARDLAIVEEPDETKPGMLSVADLVREVRYEPDTGLMFRRTKRGEKLIHRPVAGKRHGRIRISGRSYEAHRLAWLYMFGIWPRDLLDHISGDPSDNRICNLREANRSDNAANKRRHVNGRSGLKGASLHKATGMWQAQIMVDGKKRYLGLFSTAAEAHQVYCRAATEHFGAFARAA